MKYYYTFAVEDYDYGDSAYGSDLYGESSSQTVSPSTPPTDTGGAGGPLANTGYDIIVPIALGVAVIGASAVLLAKRLRRKNS